MSVPTVRHIAISLITLCALIGIIAGIQMLSTEIQLNTGSTTTIDTTGSSEEGESVSIKEDFIEAPVKPVVQAMVGDPRVKATAYIVADVETGKVYASRNMDKAYPVASMSKLVTALVALDTISSTTLITISETDTRVASDTSMLRAGESYSLDELLKPLLLSSSNVASMAIASTTGNRAAFMEHMSAISWEVGMPKTFFADPSGLSSANVASARDIYALARYLYEYRPEILVLTTTPRYDIATTTLHDAHIASSTHPFVNDVRFIGGKTGRTPEAGETMLTLLKMDDHVVAFVILKSKYGYRALDTKYLIEDYVKDNTSSVTK